MREISKHLTHYIPLLGLFALAIIGLFVFSYDNEFKRAIVTSTAGAYIAWGTIHHIIHKDLSLSVFLEYLAISSIGLIIALSLLPT